jgi:hypothetical protein
VHGYAVCKSISLTNASWSAPERRGLSASLRSRSGGCEITQSFGVDTQATHLDLIDWTQFQQWNGNLVPAFAGRNFIGGDFIWAPGEATRALSAPSPDDFQKLALLTPMIAPIQGALATRQQTAGDLGVLFGRIDAEALCARLKASMANGELMLRESNRVNVYLQIDSSVALSSDYWAGWADTMAKATFTQSTDGAESTAEAFYPCIMCQFQQQDDVFVVAPDVAAALQQAQDQHNGLKTQCFGFWADAPDLFPELQVPDPPIDWSRLAPAPAPIWLWRFARNLQGANGQPVFASPPSFATSATNAAGDPNHYGWEYMLDTHEWQPSNAYLRYAVITDKEDGLTAADIANVVQTPLPAFRDLDLDVEGRSYHYDGGAVHAIGRYLKPTVVNSAGQPGHIVLTRAEADALSASDLDIFTIWEDINALAHAQPGNIDYFDPAFHAGTEDGRNAFAYCGGTLRQPPYSTVFFTVDFDPEDPDFLNGLTVAQAKSRILQYFHLVKTERDAFAQAHPGRYYLIGVYGKASLLEWCYRDTVGAVSMFWQSGSPGTSNRRPRRPWCHANRWQLANQSRIDPPVWIIRGADPDADWGDGGTWQLNTPLMQQLEQAEDQ